MRAWFVMNQHKMSTERHSASRAADVEHKTEAHAARFADIVARWVATGGGLGYSPVAPGTVGSLAGVALFWAVGRSVTLGWITAVGLSALGVWAATRMTQMVGQHDPPCVVIDEIVGQFVTLWLAWSLEPPTALWLFVVIGWVLFRVFDIVKPPPVRQLERLKIGLGVMADDLMAGIYGAIVLVGLQRWFFG